MFLATKTPDYSRVVHGDMGNQILLEPDKNEWFTKKCEVSCLVIISVAKIEDNSGHSSFFKI